MPLSCSSAASPFPALPELQTYLDLSLVCLRFLHENGAHLIDETLEIIRHRLVRVMKPPHTSHVAVDVFSAHVPLALC